MDVPSHAEMFDWVKGQGVNIPNNISSHALQNIYLKLPEALPHRHDLVKVSMTSIKAFTCAHCPKLITGEKSYVRCVRCGVRCHCSCAAKFSSKHWGIHHRTGGIIRYTIFDVLLATTEIHKLITSDKALEKFNVHSGMHVRCDRGTLIGRHGRIVGIGHTDNRLYWHVDGECGATILYGSCTEELMFVHGLHRVGSCARVPPKDTRKADTYEHFLTSGNPDEWKDRPYGALCPICKERYTELTRCDKCGIWMFDGLMYEMADWPKLYETDFFRLHLASHAGTRHSIHGAVELGELENVTILLKNGFEVNNRSGSGRAGHFHRTPLHFAVLRSLNVLSWEDEVMRKEEEEQVMVIELLLQHGADVYLEDDLGNTALHYAAMFPPKYNRRPEFSIMRLLVARGADTRAVNHEGLTPLALLLPQLYLFDNAG
eukprot:PhF_6_TR12889/c0_g1_i2/m.20286